MKKLSALVLALSILTLAASEARAEFHDAAKGYPLHLLGHILAPVGNLYGYVIVEPVHFVFDHLKPLFRLD